MSSTPDVSSAPLATGRACGKLILLGEHFVVHGTEALAVPLGAVETTVEVRAGAGGARGPVRLEAAADAQAERLLAAALERLDADAQAGWRVAIRSTIPMGYGLGSSAALAVALVRAVSRATGRATGRVLSTAEVNAHAHALEELVHGTPSGVDDTVVTIERPVRFRKGEGLRPLRAGARLGLVLASVGHGGSTRDAVAGVGVLARTQPEHFARLCVEASEVIAAGIAAFEAGDAVRLGPLFDANHALLRTIGVSLPSLDRLADAARAGGALGAKMTGGGLGGFIVALAADASAETRIAEALWAAGAGEVLRAEVAP
jgi:mevalonate kinase